MVDGWKMNDIIVFFAEHSTYADTYIYGHTHDEYNHTTPPL